MSNTSPVSVEAWGHGHEPDDPMAMGIYVSTHPGINKVTIDDEDHDAELGQPVRNEAGIASVSPDGLTITTASFNQPMQGVHGATAVLSLDPNLGPRGGASWVIHGPDGTELNRVMPFAFEGSTDYIRITA